jgi:hypothetical protein
LQGGSGLPGVDLGLGFVDAGPESGGPPAPEARTLPSGFFWLMGWTPIYPHSKLSTLPRKKRKRRRKKNGEGEQKRTLIPPAMENGSESMSTHTSTRSPA